MNRPKTILLTAAGAYLATICVVGQLRTASANERRTHASTCHYVYDDQNGTLYNGFVLQNASTSGGKGIFCPIASDSTLSHSSTAYLNIHGSTTNGSNNYSKACVESAWATSSTCGTSVTWSTGSGMVAQSVDTSQWVAHGDWFPYVYTMLGAQSVLYGLWMSN